MNIRIISYENINSWILGKFARRMRDDLTALNHNVEIGNEPDPNADINHHIIYNGYKPEVPSKNDSLMITHIDDLYKINLLTKQMQTAKLGVCMSNDTMQQLIRAGIPAEKLCYVSPAHDNTMLPRRIRMGITSRVYPDGCKREDFLEKVAEEISPEMFEFSIMGAGWEKIIRKMETRGIKVNYYPDFDNDQYIVLMQNIDYYLYLGMDEGSMGFLDALAAGVDTIVTAQGFHLDVKDGITHAFTELPELIEIFQSIEAERRSLMLSVADWSWPTYSAKHAQLWSYLLTSNIAEQSRQYTDGLTSLLDKQASHITDDRYTLSKSKLFATSMKRKVKKAKSMLSLDELRKRLKGGSAK